jgi:hypothetical protein
MPEKFYVAWNEAKTQGFATTDQQLAYEARKGSDTNCFDENGVRSDIAIAFCGATGDENCTIQSVNVAQPPEGETKFIFEESTGEYYACIPIRFENTEFVYYGEDHAYLQFYPIAIPGEENLPEMIRRVAEARYGHLFQCVEVIAFDDGYSQLTIKAKPGENLWDVINSTEMTVNDER